MIYIKSFFEQLGFSVTEIHETDPTPLVDIFRITCDKPPVLTFFRWKSAENNKKFFHLIKDKLRSILRKGIQFDKEVYDYDRLQAFVDAYYPNLSPDEKLNSVVAYIDSFASYEGELVQIEYPGDDIANHYFFNNKDEWNFYLRTAISLDLINEFGPETKNDETCYSLTIDGLKYLIADKESKQSNTCFVAMSFSDDMISIFQDVIAPAIIQCGFEPYVVNRVHIDSDKTINDAIIAGIKKAHFTIADFTHHKNGVYFEAGYALGRGQKVIYTCQKKHLGKSHFDTRNYQHVVWQDAVDFKQKLIDKIEAFIKD